MITIKDDFGKNYVIKDNSVHEENGYWFKVTDRFYKKVMSILE